MANIKISDLPLIANIPPTSGEFPIVYNNVTYKMNWSQLNNQITASGANPLNVTGTGTTNSVPKWTTGGSVLGDSLIEDNGSIVTINGNIKIPNSGTIGSAGTSNAITILSGGQVGINGTPINDFHVFGSIMSIQGPTASLRLRGTGINMLIDLSSKNGYFEIKDVNDGRPIYIADPGVNGYQRWYINGTQKMMLDSGGNLGIGTTPSDWKSTWKALNIGQSVGLFSQDNNTTGLSSNVIFDGTSWKNKNIGATAFYQQSEGEHYFYGNGSSTDAAGTTFSPTTRLTISSGGNVGIGVAPYVYSRLTTEGSDNTSSNFAFIAYNENTDAILACRNDLNLGINNAGSLRFNGVTDNTHAVGYDSTIDGSFLRGQLGIRFLTGTGGGSEKMRISSGGNVGIGTDDPQDKLEIKSGYLRMFDPSSGANAGYPIRWASNNGGTNVTFAEITGITTSSGNRTGDLVFSTSSGGAPTEKMRISSGGVTSLFANIGSAVDNAQLQIKSDGSAVTTGLMFINAANTSSFNDLAGIASYIESGNAKGNLKFWTRNSDGNNNDRTTRLTISSGGNATFTGSVTADGGMVINGNTGLTSNNYGSGKNSSFLSSHASQPQGILIHYTGASPNGTGNLFIECHDNTAQRFTVRSNGGVANYSNNNANLSDESVKKNITDTPDSLDIIKNLEVKDFQYIDQTDDKIHTGVIAQQVLKTDPSLVDQSGELKMVYNTDLMFKMLKAIQEQQTLIDTLTARIDTLENN